MGIEERLLRRFDLPTKTRPLLDAALGAAREVRDTVRVSQTKRGGKFAQRRACQPTLTDAEKWEDPDRELNPSMYWNITVEKIAAVRRSKG